MAEMDKSFLLLALLVAELAITCSGDAAVPVRMELTRPDVAASGLTPREMLRRMALHGKARAAQFRSGSSSSSVSAQVFPGKGDPNTVYRVKLAVGTPPQPVELLLDTGSDLIWTQCGTNCPSCYDQPLPYFQPSRSSNLPCFSSACQDLEMSSCGTPKSQWGNQSCVYTYSYGDKAVTTGILVADTFRFAGAAPNVTFGCGLYNQGLFTFNATGTGIVGFGRGPLSLPSQLKVDNFSYCFTALTGSKPSPVLLGLPTNLYSNSAHGLQTTPLIQSPTNPTYYYLPLKGITVGSTRLAIPESTFALTKNGTGGAVIDSGTSVTMLPPHVYRHVRDAFVSQVKLHKTTDDDGLGLLCFAVLPRAKKPRMPRLVFHFEGATLDLPRENYLIDYEEKGRREICVVLAEGRDEMTIIGNYQQQNMHILYDLAGNKLSFVPARCDRV